MARKLNTEPRATEEERASLIAYLRELRDYWGPYRTHKENVTWLAMTLTVGLLSALDLVLVQYSFTGSIRSWIAILATGSSVLAIFFMVQQTRDRMFASVLLNACHAVSTECLFGDPLPRAALDLKAFKDQGISRWLLPQVLWKHMVDLRRPGNKYRLRTLWNIKAPFVAVALWGAISLALVWPPW